MKTALILIDIQNDYFPSGKYELAGSLAAADKAKDVLDYFRRRSLPVFHIQHISTSPDASFFLPDTTGSHIHDTVTPHDDEPVFIKHTPDSFFETSLYEALIAQNIQRLLIAGMMTHMCIDTSVRRARSLGYESTVISDACATRDLHWQQEQLPASMVQSVYLASLQGSFATVIDAQQALKKDW